MPDALLSLDRSVFFLINQTLSNPVFDLILPFLTDLNRMLGGKIFFIGVLLLLLIRGGRKGRIAVLVLIVTITLSDRLSSFGIKPLVNRERPCQTLEGVRLLTNCGGGKSFPSSHAVNMTAAAVVLASFYKRWRWGFYAIAGMICYSRPYVGVHYPSDVIGGALIGLCIGWLMVRAERWIESEISRRRALRAERSGGDKA